MTPGDEVFTSYVATYVDALRGVRYQHLSLLQPGPHANLAHGGAGTAYALWRLGSAASRAWITAALADRRRAAYDRFDRGSYVFGRAGLQCVRALAARPGEPRRAAVRAFVRHARDARGRELELMQGIAGHLTGACAMLRRFEDGSLRRTADALAGDLLDAVRRRSRRPWRALDATNVAHGWPGILHALLTWTAEVPPWLVDSMRKLTRVWRGDTIERLDNRASWCTGSAGAAILWCKAFERTGDEAFRRAARDAARAALAAEPALPHLCCGSGGIAYALLALERIDPGERWREQAREVGARAVTATMTTRWPSGLLWGHPGLICLALDLVADRPLGFPCIEV